MAPPVGTLQLGTKRASELADGSVSDGSVSDGSVGDGSAGDDNRGDGSVGGRAVDGDDGDGGQGDDGFPRGRGRPKLFRAPCLRCGTLRSAMLTDSVFGVRGVPIFSRLEGFAPFTH